MRRLKSHTISTITLWICMFIILNIFGGFYFTYFRNGEEGNPAQTERLLITLYSTLAIVCFSVLSFSIYRFITGGKDYFRTVFRSLLSAGIIGILLFVCYRLGSGEALPIPGYKGSENTYYWLKISDMWIYSIRFLLGFSILTIFVGILWNYLKKK